MIFKLFSYCFHIFHQNFPTINFFSQTQTRPPAKKKKKRNLLSFNLRKKYDSVILLALTNTRLKSKFLYSRFVCPVDTSITSPQKPAPRSIFWIFGRHDIARQAQLPIYLTIYVQWEEPTRRLSSKHNWEPGSRPRRQQTVLDYTYIYFIIITIFLSTYF